MVKRLLKKYKYPPEDYDYAISTVISQCELWTDYVDVSEPEHKTVSYFVPLKKSIPLAAETSSYEMKE